MDPPLDYADPERWERFWYVVLGQQFQGTFGPLPSLPDIVGAASGTSWSGASGCWPSWSRPGSWLGVIRHPRLVALTGLWFVCTWVFALGYANAAIERYYLVPLRGRMPVARAGGRPRLGCAARGRDRAARRAGRGRAAHRDGRARRVVAGTRRRPPRRGAGRGARPQVARSTPPTRRSAATGSRPPWPPCEPDAAVVSWWSFSTPLWYGRWVEGRRDDIVIVDDRDVLDDGYGTGEVAIDHFLGRAARLHRAPRADLPALAERYELERVPTAAEPRRSVPRPRPARVTPERNGSAYDCGHG